MEISRFLFPNPQISSFNNHPRALINIQRGAKFVVKVRVVQIKGVRILVEHFIETLSDREVCAETMDVERAVSLVVISPLY